MRKSMTLKLAAALVAVSALAACNSGPTATGNYQYTMLGVAAGTLAGAGIGATIGGNDEDNILVGAGAGAAIGGLLGYGLDGGYGL